MISFEYASSQVWAIKEENLKFILELLSRETPNLAEVEARLGRKLENKRATRLDGNVKVIELRGPIVRYGNMFTDVSGATSLSQLKNDYLQALSDETVSAILFDIDSPGGEASGIEEFAELIYSNRGVKPTASYVGNMACSAAYWIASATDKIYAGKTATLGSIGCVAVLQDTEERDTKEGIKNIKFISSNSPNKRPDPKTEEGKSLIQEQIDKIGDIFIEAVARNRSSEARQLSFRDVISKFNKGGVMIGADAVEAGLADELGSYESVLFNLTSGGTVTLDNEKETSMGVENKEIKKEDAVSGEGVQAVAGGAIASAIPSVSLEEFNALKETAEKLKENNDKLTAKLEDYATKFAEFEKITLEAEEKALKLEAEQKVASFKDKMTPAQTESSVKAYIQASKDDKNSPIEGYSRVSNLVEVWEALPKHNLTEELLKDDETITLENKTKAEGGDTNELYAAIDAQVEKYLATRKG